MPGTGSASSRSTTALTPGLARMTPSGGLAPLLAGPSRVPVTASRRSVRTTGSPPATGQREAAGAQRAEAATLPRPAGFRGHRPRWPAASRAPAAAAVRVRAQGPRGPGLTVQPRPRRAAPVLVLPVRPAARHPDPTGIGAAARPRHDRPARRSAGRLPLLVR